MLFVLGSKIFCIEAKMKPDEAQLKSYLTRIKPLGFDNKAILIVTADKSAEECQKLAEALNVRVTGLANFEQTLKTMLDSAN